MTSFSSNDTLNFTSDLLVREGSAVLNSTPTTTSDADPQTRLTSSDPDPRTHLTSSDPDPQAHLTSSDPDLQIRPVPNLSDYILPPNLAHLNCTYTVTDGRTSDQHSASILSNETTLADTQAANPPELTFIRGRRGGQQACYVGFIYTFDRDRKNGTYYWQCRERKEYTPNCTARLITVGNTDGATVRQNPEHCHPPSYTEVLKSTVISNVKYDTSNKTPGNVVKDALKSTPADVKALLPKAHLLKKCNRRYRNKLHLAPSVPATAADIVIPDEYTVDAFSNTFLQLDTTTREGYRVLLFSTDIALNACNYSTVHIIYADGTFKVAPPQFTQLWVIRGHFSHNTVLPIAYALLENKRATSYLTVVEFISHRCPNLNPVTVVLDFEKAEHKAFRTCYPNAEVQGCLFHFNQAQLKQFRAIPDFFKDQPLRQTLSSVYGLPFLPVDDVLPTWTELKTLAFNLRPCPAISKYIAYIEKNWIFNSSYPISMWNVSTAVEYDEPRTNNSSEGGNNGLARMFNSQHPSLWTFIDGLRAFHAEQEMKYQQLSQGESPNEPQRKKWREREAKLRMLVDNYDRSNKLDFIQKVSYNMS